MNFGRKCRPTNPRGHADIKDKAKSSNYKDSMASIMRICTGHAKIHSHLLVENVDQTAIAYIFAATPLILLRASPQESASHHWIQREQLNHADFEIARQRKTQNEFSVTRRHEINVFHEFLSTHQLPGTRGYQRSSKSVKLERFSGFNNADLH